MLLAVEIPNLASAFHGFPIPYNPATAMPN